MTPSPASWEKKNGPVLSAGSDFPALCGGYLPGTLCPDPSSPRPPLPAPLIRLHPEGPPGSASIRASPPRRVSPVPAHLSPHTGRLSLRSKTWSPAPAFGFRTVLTLSSQGANSASPGGLATGTTEDLSSHRLCTHLISHGPVRLFSPRHGPCQEANSSICTDRAQLGPPPPSPSPPRHITGLRRQRGILATATAAATARTPPLRAALPVVASGAVGTVGPPKTTIPEMHCAPGLLPWPGNLRPGILLVGNAVHTGKRSLHYNPAPLKL